MKRLHKNSLIKGFLSFCLILNTSFIYPAEASSLDSCRIATSRNSYVSLGFPVATERLKGNPKILVIPYKLKDTPYVFADKDKNTAIEAAKIIQKLSGNQSNPIIEFAPLQELDLVKEDIVQLKVNQQNGWQKRDETKSTWGFIRKVVDDADSKIDYSGVDAVILQGPTSSDQTWLGRSSIAEAMMFFKDPNDTFFRQIKTKEGEIYNASLINGYLYDATTYAHEILHLYGLTDLYGGSSSPTFNSIMAGQNHRLLAHEKWVLGWLPDSQVTCLDGTDSGSVKKQITEVKFSNENKDELIVIRQNLSTEAIIIEKVATTNQITQGTDLYLAFYTLKNDERPPVFMIPVPGVTTSVITKYNGEPTPRFISNILKSDDYQLLISNIDTQGISLKLIPKPEFDKVPALQATARIVQAEAEAKVRAEADAKAKALADAEAKAKAEADAKAKANTVPNSVPKIAPKPKTIICVKGKSTKKVTALNPKCPAGFKQR
jgi:hypothetical protein